MAALKDSPRPELGVFTICSVITLLLAVNTVSVDTLAPSIPALRDYFRVETSQANLVFSVYVFSYGVTQLIYGPISDKYGRRPVLLTGMFLFGCATFLGAFAPSFEVLLIARALQGATGSAAPAVARAVIRDLYGVEGSRKILSYVMSAFGFIAIITPIIGGFLVAWQGWQGSLFFCSVYAISCVCAVFVFLKESKPENSTPSLQLTKVFRTYLRLTPNPVFALNTVTNIFMYSAMFVWLTGSMLLLIDSYFISPKIAGVYFALGSAGFMVGAGMSGKLGVKLGPHKLIIIGSVLASVAGGLIAGIGFAAVKSGLAVSCGAFLWMLGHGLHFPQSMAGAVAPFPKEAGAASALIGFYQTIAAAVAAFLIGTLHDGTAVTFGLLMFSLSVAALLSYWPFYRKINKI